MGSSSAGTLVYLIPVTSTEQETSVGGVDPKEEISANIEEQTSADETHPVRNDARWNELKSFLAAKSAQEPNPN